MSKRSKKKMTVPPQNPHPIRSTPAQVTQQIPINDKPQMLQLIQNLEGVRGGNRAIIYWLPPIARISEAVVVSLYDQLVSIGHPRAIDLVLFTNGGDTEIPIRLVTLIREFCDRFSVLIPYRAYSAGTLVAMGADEIVMTPLGVLGPIDPTRTHPLLPTRAGAQQAEPISVQDMRYAMKFITETAPLGEDARYTPEAMAEIVIALFDKIHPLAIGAIEQSYALAKLIGIKCLSTHMNPVQEKDEIDRIVNKLCDDYKSHAFQISRNEARDIGLKVVNANPREDTALTDILKFYMARNMGVPIRPTIGQTFKMYIAWLDSTSIQLRCEADAKLEQDGRIDTLGDNWMRY